MYKSFPRDEFFNLTTELEIYSEIFSTIFKICRPSFTDQIPTACVVFNSSGNHIDFLINKDFWDSIDDYTKKFIICHEISHVILCHGMRMKPYRTKFSPETLNVALDLAVNHLLTDKFNFNRFMINGWEKLCWTDTILKDLILEPNKSFEYYIDRIEPLCQEISVEVLDHSYLDGLSENINEKIRDTANETNKTLDKNKMNHVKEIMKNFKSTCGRSNSESDVFTQFIGDDIKYKLVKKWESVLKKAVTIGDRERERSQWARINRRIAFMNTNLLLPSDMETIEREPYKYKVWLFLDYSGSCSSLKEPFFHASNTFDKKKFEVRKFAHCIRVAEFKGKEVNISGYSTSFTCIEEFIQNKKQLGEIKKYPDFIFHFTDGWGDNVQPEYPKRWHVFLTNHSSKSCFPSEVNIYKLQDFVLENI